MIIPTDIVWNISGQRYHQPHPESSLRCGWDLDLRSESLPETAPWKAVATGENAMERVKGLIS